MAWRVYPGALAPAWRPGHGFAGNGHASGRVLYMDGRAFHPRRLSSLAGNAVGGDERCGQRLSFSSAPAPCHPAILGLDFCPLNRLRGGTNSLIVAVLAGAGVRDLDE